MVIDYSKIDAVQSTMLDYIKTMLDEIRRTMDGESKTPAALLVFGVNEGAIKLNAKDL
jgi:hypothetical protein